jgi:hypothetical protein
MERAMPTQTTTFTSSTGNGTIICMADTSGQVLVDGAATGPVQNAVLFTLTNGERWLEILGKTRCWAFLPRDMSILFKNMDLSGPLPNP